jgi:hypothetical protein
MTDRDGPFVSASELARMGYCERQVAFDASHGRRATAEQEQARSRGQKAHAAFYDESRRIAAASATRGRCFIATLVLGECRETRALRAFRDLYLRRSAFGRWVVGSYYRTSPALCAWLQIRPRAIWSIRWLLKGLARAVGAAVQLKVGRDHE